MDFYFALRLNYFVTVQNSSVSLYILLFVDTDICTELQCGFVYKLRLSRKDS